MEARRVQVIATTISGSIQDWGKVEKIVPLFREHGRDDVDLHVVESHREARESTRDLVSRGSRTIISAGGSGTFNAVLEGCIDSGVGLGEITLGFLRKGSADLVGKTLRMPDEIGEAVRVFAESLASGATTPCDVIRVEGAGEKEGPRHFVGYAGTGIFGRIPHYTENRFIKYYKGVLGQLFGDMGPFFVGATLASIELSFRKLWRGRAEWRIRLDGDDASRAAYQAMIIVNGDLGSDLPFARNVPLGSGDFHIFALRDLGTHRLPGQFKRSWDASILDDSERFGFEAYRAAGSLELTPRSDRPFPVNVDGSTLKCTGSVLFEIADRIHVISRE